MDNSDTATPQKAPRQVLFIDDEHDFETLIRQRFRKLVRSGELEVHFAYNGAEGLNMLRKNPEIGIVFTDINMPEMDGITFLKELEGEEWQDRLLRVVVVTAFGNMKNIRHAMNSGAFDFITKPVEFDDLKATLEKAGGELDKMREGREAARQLEAAIREKELARASEKLKEDFFSNITHELRTPLTLIMGPVEQLMRNPRDHAAVEKLSKVHKNSRRLLQLINRLLDLSRLEAGSMKLQLARVDVVVLLREAIASFSELAVRKRIELVLQGGPDQFFTDLDPDKILQVLFNLLSNAIKFTPEGGRVLVQLTDLQDGSFSISVKDTGLGIPEAHLSHVFDRFFRVEGRPGKGTGIGLALCKELVELHGGEMSVRSIEGLGSEFIFRLPREEKATETWKSDHWVPELPDDREVNIFSSSGNEAEEDEEEEGAQSLPGILIVEDNPEMQDLIASELEGSYVLKRASNGREGLEIARAMVPDLIVCDVMMPEMDGFEFSRQIKNDETTSHIPLVLLTAKATLDDRLEGLELGVDDYLTKPFEGRELRVRIQNLIKGRLQLRDYFRNQFLTSPGEIKARSREEEFLLKIKSLIQDHLSDELFGVEALCEELGMSRTQVHRKLKALTGNSAGYFIRTFRLETGMEMLRRDTGNISEIAYAVGFSSPSYFTKCFTDHFNLTPREVRKSIGN